MLEVTPHENVQGILRAGPTEKGHSVLLIKIGDKEYNLGKKACISAKYDNTKNIMIFSMGCLSDNEEYKMPGETPEGIIFDKRFEEFGDHILIIRDAKEFSKRYANALRRRKGIFKPEYLHKGFGKVNYKNLYAHSGPIGIYCKDQRFDWQIELRLAIGAEDKALNSRGALELNIGDISDITSISPLKSILETPIKMKRTKVQQIGNKWFALNS
jgi:hypothetical protein